MRLGLGMRLSDILKGGAAPVVPKSTLVDDLVSYWSLDEESGTRADSVGDNDLTDNNTVLYDTGVNGNAASFVAANAEYLSRDPITVGQNGNGMTFAVWYYLTQDGNYPSPLAAEVGGSGKLPFGIYHSNTSAYGRFTDSEHTQQVTDAITTTLNAWHLAIGWFDPADKKGYLSIDNGTAAATTALGTTSLDTYTALWLGKWSYGTYDGLIDEVAIWSRVLTADERAELYNSGAGRYYNATSEDFEE